MTSWKDGALLRALPGVLALGLMLVVVGQPAVGQADRGLSWELETVEAGVYGTGAIGLALDLDGHPRVAYADGNDGTLRYGHRTDAGWHVEAVPGAGRVQGRVSLALDGGDRPHISFYDASTGTIRHAFHTGFSWLLRTVDRSHYLGDSSLALDRDGQPHVAYVWFNGELRMGHLEAGSWVPELVDGDVVTARFPDLAFGPDGIPRIAYYGNVRLLLSELTEYGWVRESVDPDAVPQFVDLAIGVNGLLAIGYRDDESETLRFASWNVTGWSWEVVAEGDVGWDARLGLDALERAHVSHYDRETGQFMYALREEGGWTFQVVDAQGVTGWWSALALAPNGSPHLAYYSWTAKAVQFARGSFELGIRTWTPSDVGATNAILRGELMGMGDASQVEVSFEWRAVGGDWQATEPLIRTSPGIFQEELGGLDPGRVYEVRAVASNHGEVLRGEIVSFTTAPIPAPDPLIPETVLVAGLVTGVLAGLAAYLVSIWRRKAYE